MAKKPDELVRHRIGIYSNADVSRRDLAFQGFSRQRDRDIHMVLRLVGRIYDCAFQPRLWPVVCDEIVEYVEGRHGRLPDSSISDFAHALSARALTASQRARLRALTPHLRRALRIMEQLRTAWQLHRATEIALESLSGAAMLVDDSGAVTFCNAAARRLLIQAPRSADSQTRFWFMTQQKRDRAALQASLQHVLATSYTPGRPPYRVTIIRTGPRPYAVEVCSLGPCTADAAACIPRALVLINDLGAAFEMDRDLLLRRFAFTMAEARVACLLGAGQSVASAARVLRVAPSTVRSHLKSIFVKAGVQRQSELVRLLSHLSRSLVGRRTLE